MVGDDGWRAADLVGVLEATVLAALPDDEVELVLLHGAALLCPPPHSASGR